MSQKVGISIKSRKKIGPLVLGSFGMKYTGFHALKFGRFHEIWRISWLRNLLDFMAMKSAKF